MVALYQISTNTVIQNYGDMVPPKVVVPGMDVHNPPSNWASGDYEFIPVVYQGAPNNDFQIPTDHTEVVTFDGNGSPSYVITTTYGYPTLAQVQENLCDRVDRKAQEFRYKYTGGDSTLLSSNILRFQEAKAILADPAPDANNYPLNAEFVNTAVANTITDAANYTVNTFITWIKPLAKIDKIRILEERLINNANTIAGAIFVYNHIDWGTL